MQLFPENSLRLACEFADERVEGTHLWPRRINIGNCRWVLGRGTSARDRAEESERPRKSECRSNMNRNGTGLAIGDTLSDIRETRRREKRRREETSPRVMIKIHYRRAIVHHIYIT